MAYEVRITRDPLDGRKGEGAWIHLEQWYDLVHRDQDLRLVAASEPELYPPLTVRRIAHPDAASENAPQWLHYGCGDIGVNYPDEPMMAKMVEMARQLGAIVIGDNGELYDLGDDGELVVREEGPPTPPGPALYGLGAGPCRDLTARMARDPANGATLHYTWYLGFLSSFNQDRHDRGELVVNYPLTPDRAAEDIALLRSYAEQYPENRFAQAAVALIRLHALRLNP